MRQLSWLIGLLLVVVAKPSSAAIIVQYNFDGQPGNQMTTPVAFAATGISASGITRGSGIDAISTANSMNSDNWTTGTSISVNDYYELSIAPNSGYLASLNSISFRERRSGTGIRRFELRSSLDGFAATLAGSLTVVPDNTTERDQTLPLGAPFTNFTSAITFRLFGYEAESAAGTWRLANHSTLNGFVLDGTVTPVPEPTTFGTLIIASFTAWAVRRRKASRNPAHPLASA